MRYLHTFTVFTPSHNRAHTLHRVYESLASQTFTDFEWLVVDDGSTDHTRALVESWARRARFCIRYRWQPQSGKHIALNHGVREARGQLFLPLDSDDGCVPTALERFIHHWGNIPADRRAQFSAVTALCMDQTGRLVGRPFPMDVADSDSLEMRYRYGITCEKWGFHRTDVLREFPFPESAPRGYLPESIVWSKIARSYKTRFVNEALRIYYIDAPSLVRGGHPGRHAASGRLAPLMTLNEELDYFRYAPLAFCRSAAQYVRLSLHAGKGVADQSREVTTWSGKGLWLLSVPAGLAAYVRDRWVAGRLPFSSTG